MGFGLLLVMGGNFSMVFGCLSMMTYLSSGLSDWHRALQVGTTVNSDKAFDIMKDFVTLRALSLNCLSRWDIIPWMIVCMFVARDIKRLSDEVEVGSQRKYTRLLFWNLIV